MNTEKGSLKMRLISALSLPEMKRIIRLLQPYVKKYKWAYFGLVALMLINIGITLAFAWFFGNVVDAAVSGDFQTLRRFIVIGLALGLAQIGTSFLWTQLEAVAMNAIKRDLTQDLYQHVLLLPQQELTSIHSGELLSHFTNDLKSIDGVIGSGLLNLLRLPIMTLAALIYLLSISWSLTLISIAVAPFAVIGGIVFGLLLRNNSRTMYELMGRITRTLSDTFQGVQVIRSFTLEKSFHRHYADQTGGLYSLQVKDARIRGLFVAAGSAVGTVTFLVSLLLGAYFVTMGAITAGALLTFVNLVRLLVSPLTGVAGQWAGYQHAVSALERITRIFDMRQVSNELPFRQQPSKLKEGLSIEKIHFSYSENESLFADFSLFIPAGKVTAIVGPSGAGKSTLFQLMLAFYPLQQGTIRFDGEEIASLGIAEIRSRVAYVPQDTFLFSGTIRDNILLANDRASEQEMIGAAMSANIHSFICSLPDGYDTEIGERGVRLSGGQKQRIAIARALLKNAPILLLDEATSALDQENETLIKEAMTRLVKGRTTVVIAHRLSTIQDADHIIVMDQGRILQAGTHDRLKRENGLYKRLLAHEKKREVESITG